MFTEKNIIGILEKELIGKLVEVCIYDKPIIEKYSIEVKKSISVTDKQFLSGDKKYRVNSIKEKVIGRDKKFEQSKIIRIWFETEEFGNGKILRAELENGFLIDVQN